jgi:hypothetical protein
MKAGHKIWNVECQECPQGQFNETGKKRIRKLAVREVRWKGEGVVDDILSADLIQ